MRQVITAADVEAAAGGGKSLQVEAGAMITALARDRAAELGVSISEAAPTAVSVSTNPALLAKVRSVTRQALLRSGRGLGDLDSVVSEVMRRLDGCDCGCK
jgi:hypothetical protein